MGYFQPGQLCMHVTSPCGVLHALQLRVRFFFTPRKCSRPKLLLNVIPYALNALLARQSHDAQVYRVSPKGFKGLLDCSAGSSWAVRLVSLAFMFFSMVISASFTANLSSQLTVRLLTSESFTLRVRPAHAVEVHARMPRQWRASQLGVLPRNTESTFCCWAMQRAPPRLQ